MPNFTVISDLANPFPNNSREGYQSVAAFKPKAKRHDQYWCVLVEKLEKEIPSCQRWQKGILGVIATIFTLSLAYFLSKAVRQLFHKTTKIRFAVEIPKDGKLGGIIRQINGWSDAALKGKYLDALKLYSSPQNKISSNQPPSPKLNLDKSGLDLLDSDSPKSPKTPSPEKQPQAEKQPPPQQQPPQQQPPQQQPSQQQPSQQQPSQQQPSQQQPPQQQPSQQQPSQQQPSQQQPSQQQPSQQQPSQQQPSQQQPSQQQPSQQQPSQQQPSQQQPSQQQPSQQQPSQQQPSQQQPSQQQPSQQQPSQQQPSQQQPSQQQPSQQQPSQQQPSQQQPPQQQPSQQQPSQQQPSQQQPSQQQPSQQQPSQQQPSQQQPSQQQPSQQQPSQQQPSQQQPSQKQQPSASSSGHGAAASNAHGANGTTSKPTGAGISQTGKQTIPSSQASNSARGSATKTEFAIDPDLWKQLRAVYRNLREQRLLITNQLSENDKGMNVEDSSAQIMLHQQILLDHQMELFRSVNMNQENPPAKGSVNEHALNRLYEQFLLKSEPQSSVPRQQPATSEKPLVEREMWQRLQQKYTEVQDERALLELRVSSANSLDHSEESELRLRLADLVDLMSLFRSLNIEKATPPKKEKTTTLALNDALTGLERVFGEDWLNQNTQPSVSISAPSSAAAGAGSRASGVDQAGYKEMCTTSAYLDEIEGGRWKEKKREQHSRLSIAMDALAEFIRNQGFGTILPPYVQLDLRRIGQLLFVEHITAKPESFYTPFINNLKEQKASLIGQLAPASVPDEMSITPGDKGSYRVLNCGGGVKTINLSQPKPKTKFEYIFKLLLRLQYLEHNPALIGLIDAVNNTLPTGQNPAADLLFSATGLLYGLERLQQGMPMPDSLEVPTNEQALEFFNGRFNEADQFLEDQLRRLYRT